MAGCASPSATVRKTTTSRPPSVAAKPPRTGTAATQRPAAAERVVPLGHSANGAPIQMHVFGRRRNPVFIFGGIHGSEPTSAYVARKLIEYLHEHPEAYARSSVAVLATANPDGLEAGTRTNVNRVDVNRNFPASNWHRAKRRTQYYGGPDPASEPETRALIQAVERLRPARIVSIHSIARGRHCNNFDGPARELATAMSAENGYKVRGTMGYPTPGSFGTWAGVDRQIPTITLELPREQSGPQSWKENRDALLAAIQFPTNAGK